MFSGLPGSKQKIGQSFARGTTLAFWQASAPIGWTKITTQNDALLRVVSGNGGPLGGGGSNGFSAINAQTVVGSTTLSTTQMPLHNHSIADPGHSHTVPSNSAVNSGGPAAAGYSSSAATLSTNSSTTGISIQNNGSGSSHNHTISMSILYIDMILASKN